MEKKIISYSFKHLQDSKFQLEILTNDGVTLFQGDITDCQKHINYFIYDNPNAKFGSEPNEVLNLNNMEHKQTAVEWLEEQDNVLTMKLLEKKLTPREFVVQKSKLVEQAKQMEKEQIVDAILDNRNITSQVTLKDAKQYYNETYGETKN